MKYHYKNKRIFLISLLFILYITNIFVPTSCNLNKKDNFFKHEQYGNMMSNIINSGLVVKSNQWVYAQFVDGLYKTKLDGTDKEKITDDVVSYINLWNGWIYYCNDYPGNGEIYRITPDGSKKEKINSERSYYTIIKDGWIYYSTIKIINDVIEFKIKKIKIDGTNQIDIVSEHIKNKNITPSGYFFLSDEWIYYISISEKNMLYRVLDNGKNKSKVSDEIFIDEYSNRAYIIDKNWIYYTQPNEGNKLYKMKTDGTEKKLVINKSVGDINVTDEYIFYTDESDNYKLYKKNKSSSVVSKLTDYSVSDINLIDDWLYCRDFYSELKFYTISSAETNKSGE